MLLHIEVIKMEFQIHGNITSVNDAEMLSALEWLKNNYGPKIHSAQGTGSTKEIQFGLLEATFAEAVTAITALKTQFSTRLVEYNLTMNQ